MKKFAFLLAVLLAAAGIVTSCSGGSPNPPEGQEVATGSGHYHNISPVELNSMLIKKDFPMVNVHVPYEGEIVQTDMFIPYDKILGNLAQLPPDKNAKIVLYCRSGSMSATAASALVEAGYTDVYNLIGGMYAWQDAGYELLQKEH